MTNEPNPPTAPSSTDSFFNSVRRLGLTRTPDRWVGGVAAGIAHRLGWDPLVVRGIFFLSFFFGGLGLIAYGVLWALLPEADDDRIHLQEALCGRFDPALIGAGLIILSGLVSNGPLGWITHGLFSWNSGLFSLVTGLFWFAFSATVIFLLIRWLVDRNRYRKYLKANPDLPATVSASDNTLIVTTSGVTMDDAEPFAFDMSDEVVAPLAATGEAPIITNTVVEDIELPDDELDTLEIETTVSAVEVNETIETVIDPAAEKANKKAAANALANERAAEKAATAHANAAAKAEARAKANEERAFYRQQREVEKYQRAVERSRQPITKGPGIVTVLLTLGLLFLVWTAYQAAAHGFMVPGLGGHLYDGSLKANPLLWVGIAFLIVGAAIFISGIRGRKSGVLALLTWFGLAAAIPLSFLAAGAFGGPVHWLEGYSYGETYGNTTGWVRPAPTATAIGTGLVIPVNTGQAAAGFRGRFGSPTIDLSNLDLSEFGMGGHYADGHLNPPPLTVPIEFAAGDLVVLLPPGARVEANVRLSAGQVFYQVTDTDPEVYQDVWYDEDGNRHVEEYEGSLIRTTQVFDHDAPNLMRNPVFIATDAARLEGPNLRLAISSGAGSVTLREVAPATTPANELVNH